jgi:hypothetical protein
LAPDFFGVTDADDLLVAAFFGVMEAFSSATVSACSAWSRTLLRFPTRRAISDLLSVADAMKEARLVHGCQDDRVPLHTLDVSHPCNPREGREATKNGEQRSFAVTKES